MVWWIYNILWTALLLPLAFLRLLWRSRQFKGYRQDWLQRLGLIHFSSQTVAPIWFHMVSFGEVRAAIPLIRAFHAANPNVPLVLTTMTLTGRQALEQTFSKMATCAYVPYDSLLCVNAFFKRVKPQKLVVLETEIWPTIFRVAQKRQVPIFLVNARLSPYSVGRYQWVKRWLKPLLSSVTIASQSEADTRRFHSLGAVHAKTIGNIKYDIQLPAQLSQAIIDLKTLLGDRPVWVAASTHEGEETQVLAAHRRVLQKVPNALLILVPRHPERFAIVTALCQQSGFSVSKRTEKIAVSTTSEIFLGDTMGEMLTFMGCANAVFVGGSLVPIGGHNTLEPAALQLPICVGPHVEHFQEVTAVLKQAGGLYMISSEEALAQQISTWLQNPKEAALVGQKAYEAFSANKGAVQRLVLMLR